MNLKEMQKRLPWTIKYSRDFRANPQTHKDFAHAITHAMKALGKLSAMVDDYDHRQDSVPPPAKYVADLVICALRMANTYPKYKFDLEAAVINRMETKNNVKIHKEGDEYDIRESLRD